MSACNRCGFRAASDRNFVRSDLGLQCPRCRALVSPGMMTAATVTDPNPYVSASFLGLVTPEDVGNEKRSIDPYVEETNIKAGLAKEKIPANLMQQWNDFYVSWKDFYSSVPIPTGPAYKSALSYRAKLHTFQSQLNPYLAEKATPVPMAEETPPNAAGPSTGAGGGITDALARASDKWSTVAIVGLVVGGGILGYIIYSQAKNAARLSDKTVELLPSILPHMA